MSDSEASYKEKDAIITTTEDAIISTTEDAIILTKEDTIISKEEKENAKENAVLDLAIEYALHRLILLSASNNLC